MMRRYEGKHRSRYLRVALVALVAGVIDLGIGATLPGVLFTISAAMIAWPMR